MTGGIVMIGESGDRTEIGIDVETAGGRGSVQMSGMQPQQLLLLSLHLLVDAAVRCAMPSMQHLAAQCDVIRHCVADVTVMNVMG